MNRAYRIVLNRGTGQWRVAGEHAGAGQEPFARRGAGGRIGGGQRHACRTGAGRCGGDWRRDTCGELERLNDLVIGNAAFGSLLIESPATIVRSASGWLGATPDGVGTATVSGLGASWRSTAAWSSAPTAAAR